MNKVVALILIAFLAISCEQQNREIDNLISFAKAYGYVKYFHPSDEAYSIDWNQFAAYGSAEVKKCRNKGELIETLYDLFKPIAPSIKFSVGNFVTDSDFNHLKPENPDSFCLTYWQHKGVGFGMKKNEYLPYESRRVLTGCKIKNNPLFEYKPKIKEVITKNLGSNIYCHIPILLYKNTEGTFPKADNDLLSEFNNKLLVSSESPKDKNVRLGNIINTFNVFQHFYPYFDVVDVSWERELRAALNRSYSDRDGKDHLITLQKFTAPLNDGHISVNSIYNHLYIPQVAWEWIEDSLVVTKVLNGDIKLKPGDVVTHIDGVNSEVFFKEIESRISASTYGWLKHQAELKSLLGLKNSILKLRVNGDNIDLKREINLYQSKHLFYENSEQYKILSDGIIYLNLKLLSTDVLNGLLPKLEKSKAIICDLRGHPSSSSFELISHLMQLNDTASAWMQTPFIVYPNQERIIGYDTFDWSDFVEAKEPYLGDNKIIFLSNGKAISASESFLGFVSGYNLGKIIGQPTAGTNGTYNFFTLNGGYGIFFTGMKVLKHDGSQHHGIGFLPDIYVERTIQGVKEGRDEFLEKAIEVVKNN